MSVHEILHPAGWKPTPGYSNGVVATGRTIFLAGQIGWDAEQQFVGDDLVAQTRQALRNIVALLAETGAGPEHIVRMTWYVTDVATYSSARKAIGAAWGAVFGRHYPPMAVVEVVRLVEARALVEIETTAVLPE